MRVVIKLYGGLVCQNEKLEGFQGNRLTLDIEPGITLWEIHHLLLKSPAENLVSLVEGRAERRDYIINMDCSISIFPPMADRKFDFFDKI